MDVLVNCGTVSVRDTADNVDAQTYVLTCVRDISIEGGITQLSD